MAAIHMNKELFEQSINHKHPVLVDFWAPWCSYCRKIEQAYDRIAEEYRGSLIVGKVNIDDYSELMKREQIELVPTLILYQNGKAIDSIVAPESKAMIEGFIREALNRNEAPAAQQAHKIHDMIIVGGGPAGYTAALYAARAGLDAVVLEKLSAGGQMALTSQIDNYSGFDDGIDGYALAEKMQRQAEQFGAKTEYAEVIRMDLTANPKIVETDKGIYSSKTVILATGAVPRELGLENEAELIGRGIAYCAACDGMFFKDKTVVVVGGGNSAAADALLLSRIAKKVVLVHRKDSLRATKIYHESLKNAENVELRLNSSVVELLHRDKLNGVRLLDAVSGAEHTLPCDGLFISVGRKPATDLVKGQLNLDSSGYIIADESTRTNLPGVYAAGDVRTKPVRQVVTAVGDGATAVHMAEEYLAEQL